MINMGELFAHDIISDIEMERVKMSDKEKAKFLVKFLVKEGDLLFARQSLVAAGAGKCSIIKNVNEPTTFESHLIRVRLNGDNADSLFYYYNTKRGQSSLMIKFERKSLTRHAIRGHFSIQLQRRRCASATPESKNGQLAFTGRAFPRGVK